MQAASLGNEALGNEALGNEALGNDALGTQPAPGWYADPWDVRCLRWWDGARWTQHCAPAAPWQLGTHDDLRWLLPVGRPGSAIAAGYLGLLSLIPNPFTAIPAVICGVVALKTLQRRPELIGRGRAVFGIVVGSLDLAFFALLLALAH